MIACLVGTSPRLAELANQFSPVIERVSDDTVAFTVDGLKALFGDFHQIAAEISRRGAQMEISANLAIAANKSTAILVARNCPGISVVRPGQESGALTNIPLEAVNTSSELFETFQRWGIHTLGDLAALPEVGIAERLGTAGMNLRRLALGQGGDIVTLSRNLPQYVLKREMDDAIEQLEPLLFVISAHLHELTESLRRDGHAAGGVSLTLTLDNRETFERTITLPVATRDPLVILKQLQLSLEAQAPGAGILIVETRLVPADPRVIQGGLFRPSAPEPDKLQTLLARLGALVGTENVGSPEILDTHRPDAFRMRCYALEASDPKSTDQYPLRVVFRHFRPNLEVRVITKNHDPVRVISARVSGSVVHSAGPWRTSGGIWAATSWDRDEWDVVLEDQAMYRIYLTPSKKWFLCGSYD